MMSRQVRDFGHGQLRFLEIAMAIRHAPRVLLPDEPDAGLSQSEMEGLEAVVRDLVDLGVAVVMGTRPIHCSAPSEVVQRTGDTRS